MAAVEEDAPAAAQGHEALLFGPLAGLCDGNQRVTPRRKKKEEDESLMAAQESRVMPKWPTPVSTVRSASNTGDQPQSAASKTEVRFMHTTDNAGWQQEGGVEAALAAYSSHNGSVMGNGASGASPSTPRPPPRWSKPQAELAYVSQTPQVSVREALVPFA